jgi:hypothetical protein
MKYLEAIANAFLADQKGPKLIEKLWTAIDQYEYTFDLDDNRYFSIVMTRNYDGEGLPRDKRIEVIISLWNRKILKSPEPLARSSILIESINHLKVKVLSDSLGFNDVVFDDVNEIMGYLVSEVNNRMKIMVLESSD